MNKLVIRSDGKIYASIQEAASAHGENLQLFRERITKYPTYQGYSYEICNPRYLRRSDGKRYDTIPEAARDNCVSVGAIKAAISVGCNVAGYRWQWFDVVEELKPKPAPPREAYTTYTMQIFKARSYAKIGQIDFTCKQGATDWETDDKHCQPTAMAIFGYLMAPESRHYRDALIKVCDRATVRAINEHFLADGQLPKQFWAKIRLKTPGKTYWLKTQDDHNGSPIPPTEDCDPLIPTRRFNPESLVRLAESA